MSRPGTPHHDRSPRSQPVGIPRSPRNDELRRATSPADATAQATLAAYLNPGGITPPPNIPPRAGSRQGFSSSPVLGGPAFPSPFLSGTSTPIPGLDLAHVPIPGGSQETPVRGRTPTLMDLDTLPAEEKARILRRHLVSREERGESVGRRDTTPAEQQPGGRPRIGNTVHFPSDEPLLADERSITPLQGSEDDAEFPIPYSTHGGDITHGIYKWQSNAQREAMRRARSTSLIVDRNSHVDPRFQHIHEPGGFRRNYLLLKADEQREGSPPVMLNNFIDFLYLYGHFGGEDLEEDEEMDDEAPAYDDIPRVGTSASAAEAGLRIIREESMADGLGKPVDRQPLLPRSSAAARSLSRRRRRSTSAQPQGDATVTQAVLMLLKSFIGTGILFLGKAFYNGGILFSSLTLAFIALISLYSFILLIKTKLVVSGSFGHIGGVLYGRWMRVAILFSIVLSQFGFVCAYTIFIASNFQALILAVTNCKKLIPIQHLIFMQAIILLPLSLVRDLAKLSWTALVADAFILIGLVYIASNEFAVIGRNGIADIALFNPKSFPLLIGTAVFSFEGIGLVIPINDAMKEPRKFPAVLSGVMFFLILLFGGFGILSYLAYGSNVQTVILVNLPSEQKFVQVVQFLYASAILLSTPLQLFPAVRIMENLFFKKSVSGKMSTLVKWQKNFFRACSVFACYYVAWLGARDLDKFVSFVGSFACIPLCYVYPPMLHYKACARTRLAKARDIALGVFGLAAAIFTTWQTIKLMAEPGGSEDPQFGLCTPAGPNDSTPLNAILGYLGWNH